MHSLCNKLMILFLVFFLLPIPEASSNHSTGYIPGRVVDSLTKMPIKGAIVTVNNEVALTGEKGFFHVNAVANKVGVRAFGYTRAEQDVKSALVSQILSVPMQIELVPFTPKALYLSFYGIGSKILKDSALKLIEETELNALVIDVKGDRGLITYKSSVPLTEEIGAQKITIIKDIKTLITSLKEKGIYTIARIVVFKDSPLASSKPGWALKTHAGEQWRDKENLAWVDPFRREVWNYNIDIAVEAARNGFDEIQFDYIRFPDSNGFAFSMPNTQENRVNAVTGFLMEARKRLLPFNVFLSADVFGYVLWNLNDTNIGQKIEDLLVHLDYIAPMLYPSGFHAGIPGYRNPVANTHEIVYLTLKRAAERTKLPPVRFRPWLQAFKDYAFDRRQFKEKEIRDQIHGAERFGSHGWMLWNPRNVYSEEGLNKSIQLSKTHFLAALKGGH
jgi:hypothetical protein